MLKIRRHKYLKDLIIVIFVGICTLPFYVIKMDILSLFHHFYQFKLLFLSKKYMPKSKHFLHTIKRNR